MFISKKQLNELTMDVQILKSKMDQAYQEIRNNRQETYDLHNENATATNDIYSSPIYLFDGFEGIHKNFKMMARFKRMVDELSNANEPDEKEIDGLNRQIELLRGDNTKIMEWLDENE